MRLTLPILMFTLTLAACANLGGPTQVQVLGGAVTVAAPAGYCVAPDQGAEGQDTAVVLIGRCQAAGTVAPAVITVSVGHGGSGGVMAAGSAALAAFFQDAEGRQLLARSGKARDVTVLAAVAEGNVLFLHIADAAAGEYWRAMLTLDGRLITISAQGTGGLDLSAAASRTAVARTLTALQAANPAPAPVVAPVIPAESAGPAG